jgi:hypothetical protein
MIEALEDFPDNVVAFRCSGHVTGADYEDVLVPRVDQALADHDKIRLYYEVAASFTGVDPAAIWTDFKVGVEHLTRWERMAVVTDIDWIKNSIMLFQFMIPGDMKAFPLAEADAAREWIATS